MIELQLGRPVRWINPKGGWETGRTVLSRREQVFTEYGGCDKEPVQGQVRILIAGSFGGLFFVASEKLERVPMRSEWEDRPVTPEAVVA